MLRMSDFPSIAPSCKNACIIRGRHDEKLDGVQRVVSSPNRQQLEYPLEELLRRVHRRFAAGCLLQRAPHPHGSVRSRTTSTPPLISTRWPADTLFRRSAGNMVSHALVPQLRMLFSGIGVGQSLVWAVWYVRLVRRVLGPLLLHLLRLAIQTRHPR